jgi:hypothetical protein
MSILRVCDATAVHPVGVRHHGGRPLIVDSFVKREIIMDQLAEAEKRKRSNARIGAERRSKLPAWSTPELNQGKVCQSKEFTAAIGGYAAFLAAKEATATGSPDPAI